MSNVERAQRLQLLRTAQASMGHDTSADAPRPTSPSGDNSATGLQGTPAAPDVPSSAPEASGNTAQGNTALQRLWAGRTRPQRPLFHFLRLQLRESTSPDHVAGSRWQGDRGDRGSYWRVVFTVGAADRF